MIVTGNVGVRVDIEGDVTAAFACIKDALASVGVEVTSHCLSDETWAGFPDEDDEDDE